MNLQKYLPDMVLTSGMFAPLYVHRLYKNYQYTDQVREIMTRTSSSWMVERIFALQLDERVRSNAGIQHWNLKTLPDGAVFFSCADVQGRILYFEHGYPDVPPIVDLSFVLRRNILDVSKPT